MTAGARVLNPGLHTTVQDLGRVGGQRFGIPVSGALDPLALRVANVLVGNRQDLGALEMTALGVTLEVTAESMRVAVAGGSVGLVVERTGGERIDVPSLETVRLTRGDRVRVGAVTGTTVAYLAIEGGLDLPRFMGSSATYVRGGFGGFEGRALRQGDLLPLAHESVEARAEMRLEGFDLAPPQSVRVVLGPQDDYFTLAAIEAFLSAPYAVTRDADRMGIRLEGPRLEHAKGYNIVSDGIAPGAIQVPGSCQPIVLLSDRQTTGGYPKIAAVVSADLGPLGRLLPGMSVSFKAVTVGEAQQIRREQEARMAALPGRLQPVRSLGPDLDRLLDTNLVSGVVCAAEPHVP